MLSRPDHCCSKSAGSPLEMAEIVENHVQALKFLIGQQHVELAVEIFMHHRVFNVGHYILEDKVAKHVWEHLVNDATVDSDILKSRRRLCAVSKTKEPRCGEEPICFGVVKADAVVFFAVFLNRINIEIRCVAAYRHELVVFNFVADAAELECRDFF